MVFVHVPRRGRAIEPTREEAALVRDLERKGVGPGELEAALTARGIDPERARQLARLAGPRSAADRVLAVGSTLLWLGVVILLSFGERLIRSWLREHYPGSEHWAGLIVPIVIAVVFLWSILSRVRASRDAAEGTTRADQIENKPIG